MRLQTKRHNPLTPSSQTTNQLKQKLKSPNHINTANTITTDCRQMPPKQQPRKKSQPRSYLAQSKKRNAAAQPNNSYGRQSRVRRVIAELRENNKSSAHNTSPPQQTNSSLKHNNKHHLAIAVVSPARDRATARQRT